MFVRQRVKRPFIGGGRRVAPLNTDVHIIGTGADVRGAFSAVLP